MDLANISIVLVETSHPGNIGSAARAMKNMGLGKLVLVNPKYFPHPEATALASGADDVLAAAQVVARLEDALAPCHWVLGSSARSRRMEWPVLNVREAALKTFDESAQGPCAVVFGRERSGLSNEEMDHCHALLQIPSNPAYSSLNLAQAVQITAYELRMAALAGVPRPVVTRADPPATAADMERFYDHLEACLHKTEFLNPDNPRQLMRRIRRMYDRAALDQRELNILRGILNALEQGDPRGRRHSPNPSDQSNT